MTNLCGLFYFIFFSYSGISIRITKDYFNLHNSLVVFELDEVFFANHKVVHMCLFEICRGEFSIHNTHPERKFVSIRSYQ